MARENGDRIPVRRHRLPGVETFEVTLDELTTLEQQSMQVGEDFSFGAVSLAAATSFFITLITVKIESDRIFATFFAIVLAGVVFTLYFGSKWYRGRSSRKTIIQKIKERAVGPLGEEGKEIKAAELAALPAQEADQTEPQE